LPRRSNGPSRRRKTSEKGSNRQMPDFSLPPEN